MRGGTCTELKCNHMVQYALIHGDDEQEGGDSLLQHGLAMLDHLPRLHVHHLAMQDNARDIDIEVLLKMFVSCFMFRISTILAQFWQLATMFLKMIYYGSLCGNVRFNIQERSRRVRFMPIF